MKADEIVLALRRMRPQFAKPGQDVVGSAAALIESMQDQLSTAYMDGVRKVIYEIMKEADISGSNEIINSGDSDEGMCAQVAKLIKAQLAASQRREKAAVEDLSTYKDCGFCAHLQDQQYCYKNCQRHVDVDNFRTHPCWQWRGSEKGEKVYI